MGSEPRIIACEKTSVRSGIGIPRGTWLAVAICALLWAYGLTKSVLHSFRVQAPVMQAQQGPIEASR